MIPLYASKWTYSPRAIRSSAGRAWQLGPTPERIKRDEGNIDGAMEGN
jgi:hypothetical protein